ncbi:MAG TPA: dihydrodipicolinate reductase C-terminal domain-containing protein, partial [Candidatus Marinimicrobia bacterium]|nr:dihydrodipicolinate reductase C-terminal domain-containing protein [Candidatus Neomarinimicrobiota bacterium]
ITGVTGYSAEQLEAIRALGQEVPVVQSFNFSLGIQLMLKMVNLLKEPLKDWDVEIAETHHRFKKDKPSGTAKMLAATIGREVPTSSFRLGNVLGDHSIAFGSLGEIITLSHRTLSRRAFAEGALLSAEFAIRQKSGYFTFTDVLSQD